MMRVSRSTMDIASAWLYREIDWFSEDGTFVNVNVGYFKSQPGDPVTNFKRRALRAVRSLVIHSHCVHHPPARPALERALISVDFPHLRVIKTSSVDICREGFVEISPLGELEPSRCSILASAAPEVIVIDHCEEVLMETREPEELLPFQTPKSVRKHVHLFTSMWGLGDLVWDDVDAVMRHHTNPKDHKLDIVFLFIPMESDVKGHFPFATYPVAADFHHLILGIMTTVARIYKGHLTIVGLDVVLSYLKKGPSTRDGTANISISLSDFKQGIVESVWQAAYDDKGELSASPGDVDKGAGRYRGDVIFKTLEEYRDNGWDPLEIKQEGLEEGITTARLMSKMPAWKPDVGLTTCSQLMAGVSAYRSALKWSFIKNLRLCYS